MLSAVTATDAFDRMRDVAVLWSAEMAAPHAVVDAACELLVAGVGGDALARLAGLTRREADELGGVRELLPAALGELGLEPTGQGTPEAMRAVLRAYARKVVAGETPPREFCAWVHSKLGHEHGEPFAAYDDEYDVLEYSSLSEPELTPPYGMRSPRSSPALADVRG